MSDNRDIELERLNLKCLDLEGYIMELESRIASLDFMLRDLASDLNRGFDRNGLVIAVDRDYED